MDVKAQMKELQISKLDAALRQLQTAILLYFNSRDPVSTHTLTAAAYNIMRDIRNSRGVSFDMFKDAHYVVDQYKDEFKRLLNKSENFFKHADRDSTHLHRFQIATTELLLIDACDAYIKLTGEEPELIAIFKRWHAVRHPQYYLKNTAFHQVAVRVKTIYGESDKLQFMQDCLQSKFKI